MIYISKAQELVYISLRLSSKNRSRRRRRRRKMGGKKPHALVIPYPAQGHVMPLMEFSHRLVDRGFKITFLNTDFDHARIVASLPENTFDNGASIQLVSIPDGLDPEGDRNQIDNLCLALSDELFLTRLEELIEKINKEGEDKISCVIADVSLGAGLVVAQKMGIPKVAFFPAATGLLATLLHIPKLIEEGIIESTNGCSKKPHQMIKLSPTMPEMNADHFVWKCFKGPLASQIIYHYIVKNNQTIKLADWLLCNSFYDLEPSAFDFLPQAIPIGPLISTTQDGKPVGNFWPEDPTCLNWLDVQPPRSVVYVAFGSFTVVNERQFHELALGLELAGRPFLWVVRPDLMDGSQASYPEGYQTRVAQQGKMVGWAPQKKVLAHPSVACFVSHCGWNSTTEGLSNGLPFLCWPYFADQFLNKSYICDVWKVGLGFEPVSDGIIRREEIKGKVESLLCDEGVRRRALELKEMAKKSMSHGGDSFNNFNDFVANFATFTTGEGSPY